jgi:hypothetical protein
VQNSPDFGSKNLSDQSIGTVPVQLGYFTQPQNWEPLRLPLRAVRIDISPLQLGHFGESSPMPDASSMKLLAVNLPDFS